MAGGPLYHLPPYTADTAGNAFPNFYAGAGGNASPNDFGLGIVASLASDVVWQLRFPMPEVIPAGTMKLRLLALANATSGAAKVTPSDGLTAAGASPSATTLTSDGLTTLTWAAGDNDKYKEAKVALSSAPAGNEMLVVALTFNTSGWTLAQVSTWIVTVVWE